MAIFLCLKHYILTDRAVHLTQVPFVSPSWTVVFYYALFKYQQTLARNAYDVDY